LTFVAGPGYPGGDVHLQCPSNVHAMAEGV
jgi:hypothetical protein